MSAALLRALGFILLAWGAVNTGVDIQRYGLEVGHYWWFCNLALAAMGYGLVKEDRGLIIAFLAIASFTQVFWLLDNLWTLSTGNSPLGLVSYLYQPGYPLDEFLLSHYHYFTIPLGVAAVFLLPREKENAVVKAAVLNPFIFGVSYWGFSSAQNVNCIHRACFAAPENWEGPVYSLAFWGVCLVLNLVIAAGLEKVSVRPYRLGRAVLAVCLLSVLAVGLDTQYKLSLPRLRCEGALVAKDTATTGCRYISFNQGEELVVAYRTQNSTENTLLCKVGMTAGQQESILHEELLLTPHAVLDFRTTIPTPNENGQVLFQTSCRGGADLFAIGLMNQ